MEEKTLIRKYSEIKSAAQLVDAIRARCRKLRLSKLEVKACEEYLAELEHCKCSDGIIIRANSQLNTANCLVQCYEEELIDLRTLAANYISQIVDNCGRAILMSVIVNGRSVKETAKLVHYALRTVYRLKDDAMMELDIVIAQNIGTHGID